MKICIVIQSDSFRKSAGMRIRYDRVRDCLADPDVTLVAATCEELVRKKTLDHDVYIFCKTFDTAALLLARKVRAAGKVVGQDVFDDYFSQTDDPRLERFRRWMRDMAPVTQFALCSTHQIADVLREYMPGIPITPIEDPIVGYDPLLVGALADAKVKRARESRHLEIVWFGIGDNPFFPVGLRDLAAWEPELARIERNGFRVRLRIVTNRRPFEGGGAEILRGLSVPFELVEWSEDAERKALVGAAVAIIPVNGQSFSRAKSLNRAVSALNAGCQVLSLGFPLYERLSDFIYRSSEELTADIAGGNCRLRGARVRALTARLSRLANPYETASAFVRQARQAVAASAKERRVLPRLCLIHGRESKIEFHKMAMALGGVSAATVFCKAPWNFRVRFDLAGNEMVMRVTPEFAERFSLPVQASKSPVRILDFDFVEVDLAALNVAPLVAHQMDSAEPLHDLAMYQDVMRFVQDCCSKAFAPADLLIADESAISRRPPRAAGSLAGEPATGFSALDIGSAVKHSYRDVRRLLSEFGIRGGQRFRNGEARQLRRNKALLEESALFDRQWYLEQYRDVAASGLDPVRHYLVHGWREGRDPGPRFSTTAYLRANSDVAAEGINPLLHFIEFGQAEGRGAPEHAARRRAVQLREFGPAAPCAAFPAKPEPLARWKSTGQLDPRDASALLIGDRVAGYARDNLVRRSVETMLTHVADMSGSKADHAEAAAAQNRQYAILLDAWHTGAQLRTRWRSSAGEAPFVVRAIQAVGGALRLVGEGLVGNELDLVDVKLSNRFFPILFLFTSCDGEVVGWQLLAFPSLCRGGLHYPELLAISPTDDDASGAATDICGVDRLLAERLLALREHKAQPLLAKIVVDLRGADGAHALFQPDFQSWLRDVVRISVQAVGSGAADAGAYLSETVRLTSDASRSKGAARLVLGSDMAPSITALVACSAGEGAGTDEAAVPFVVAGAHHSDPATLVHPPPNALLVEHPSSVPPLPRIERDGAGNTEVREVPFFAIRSAPKRALDDADLLVPISAPGLEVPADVMGVSWLLWPEIWRAEDLLQALESLAAQTNTGPFTIIFVGSAPATAEALAGRLFEGRAHSTATLDEAIARIDTPLVAHLGASVLLHDQRSAAVLAGALRNPEAASASALVVSIDKRGKAWHVDPADAGQVGTVAGAQGAASLQPADPLLLWRGNWPAALPPRDLWMTRTESLPGWRSSPSVVDGQHICSTLVTATYCGPRSSAESPLRPPPSVEGQALRTGLIVG